MYDCSGFDPLQKNPDKYHPKANGSTQPDRVFIVFDRDDDGSKKRSDIFYKGVKSRCDGLGFEVLLTTPMFEMWLLMHHEGVECFRYSPKLTDDTRVVMANHLDILEHRKKTYPNDKYDKKIKPLKKIDKKRFNNYYRYTFDLAFNTSLADGITDFEGLLYNSGSNVGT